MRIRFARTREEGLLPHGNYGSLKRHFRCPLEDGAALKSLADAEGVTVSTYVARLVHEKVKGRVLDAAEKAWIAEHLEMNLIRRAKADAKTAAGYYKRKRRGRPRKPGTRGKKRMST